MHTVDAKEIENFAKDSSHWWDENGPFRPLHRLNPVRLQYIKDRICEAHGRDPQNLKPYKGLSILDIGCGGGLVCEPMARLGADVTGVDADANAIAVAKEHAADGGLNIIYKATSSEQLTKDKKRFDVVLALEIVEHVADPAQFIATCRDLVAPGGMLIVSTLNRTAKSFGAAIIGAEWIMRWLPRGTHEWHRFITPDELAQMAAGAGLRVVDRCGMVFNPLGWRWSLSHRDLSVNYAMTALRDA